MANTTRWGLEYQALGDGPNGAILGQNLAEDTDAALGRALPTANATTRAALVATLTTADRGLWILQDDTDALYSWTGAVLVGPFSASGGGGGSGSSRARYRQTGTAQGIPNSADTVVSFPGDVLTHADITKISTGAGHGFRFERAGVLRGSAHVRYATTTSTGVRHAHAVLGDNADYLASGGGGEAGQPVPIELAIGPVDVDEDDVLSIRCFQGTGALRNLENNGGLWVHLELELS